MVPMSEAGEPGAPAGAGGTGPSGVAVGDGADPAPGTGAADGGPATGIPGAGVAAPAPGTPGAAGDPPAPDPPAPDGQAPVPAVQGGDAAAPDPDHPLTPVAAAFAGLGPGGTPAEPPPARRRRFRVPREVRLTIMVIVLVFVIEYFLLPEIARARKDVHLLGRVNPLWLILATALEVLSLLAYAQLTYTVLSPGAPRRFRLFRINMWSLAVSHVVPGGTVGGTAASYRMLTESGVQGSTAGFGLALQGVGSAVVLNVLFWLALVVSIPVNGFNPLYGTAAIVGTLLIAAFGFSAVMLTVGKHAAVDRLARLASHIPWVSPDKVSGLVQHIADRLGLLLRDRRLLSHALTWAAANWLLDAASLWVFLIAFGHTVFPVDLLVAYGLANILAAIPLTPGGLGVVETVCVGALTGFGVPVGVAGLAVLTWRLVNFWLPIPAGGLAYLSLRLGPEARQRATHGVSRMLHRAPAEPVAAGTAPPAPAAPSPGAAGAAHGGPAVT